MALYSLLSSGSASFLDGQVVSDISTLITNITSMITGNDYLKIFFTVSLLGVGIGIFRALKSVVHQ